MIFIPSTLAILPVLGNEAALLRGCFKSFERFIIARAGINSNFTNNLQEERNRQTREIIHSCLLTND
jgi:hypothetical protein